MFLTRPESLALKTICRRNPARGAWPAIPRVHCADLLDELLQDPQIDLVVISTRHDVPTSFARKVPEAGKHCPAKKPFSLNAAEAKELFALAKEENWSCRLTRTDTMAAIFSR